MDVLRRLELYHACEQRGGREHVEANAPFLSENNPRQWLSQGYYFWVRDVTLAQEWGMHSVSGAFAIVKVVVQFSEAEIIDLIGDPVQIRVFKRMLAKFMEAMKAKFGGRYEPTVSECISYFRKLEQFPFKGVLAAENPPQEVVRRKFISMKENTIALNGRQQLCLFPGAEDLIVCKHIVEPAEWVVAGT